MILLCDTYSQDQAELFDLSPFRLTFQHLAVCLGAVRRSPVFDAFLAHSLDVDHEARAGIYLEFLCSSESPVDHQEAESCFPSCGR